MLFVINCAPEMFHKEMYNIFCISGVVKNWDNTKVENDVKLKGQMRDRTQIQFTTVYTFECAG